MTAEENAATRSPASSSAWSGPSSGGRSIETFNSETTSDPGWREPVERLRRWKHQVAQVMSTLREQGREGMDVIKRQELRARGRYTDLLMNDGSQLPEDLGFWKARHEYFVKEWRRIQEKRPGGLKSIRDSVNPCYDWIATWISDVRAVGDDDRSDASRGVVCKRQPSELPAAIVYQNQVTKKRPRDSVDRADEDNTLRSKRSKRDPPNGAKTKSRVAPSRRASIQNTRKATASVTIAQNRLHGGMAESRDKAGARKSPTTRQPLRRSPRIAALYAAKAENMETGSVGRPPPAITTTHAANS